MGWLEDLSKTTIYKFRSLEDPSNEVFGTSDELTEAFGFEVKGEPGEKLRIETDEGTLEFEYAGFEPRQLGIMTKIVFEKNGRKAVRINHGDGKSVVRSMTRENLLKGKGIKETGDKHDASGNKTGQKSYEVDSALTKGCKEASEKAKSQIFQNRLHAWKKELGMKKGKNK